MYLFFDTETTGLPRNYKAPATDTDNWPRMVQLAYVLCDRHGYELSSGNYIVQPQGFTIPSDAARIHGITTQRAMLEGVAVDTVLQHFERLLAQAHYLVAHNMAFDEKIVGAELIRAGKNNVIDDLPKICTMQSTVQLVGISRGYGGYKWPKLAELYYKLFRTQFEDAHNAAADVQATVKCFWELRRLRKI